MPHWPPPSPGPQKRQGAEGHPGQKEPQAEGYKPVPRGTVRHQEASGGREPSGTSWVPPSPCGEAPGCLPTPKSVSRTSVPTLQSDNSGSFQKPVFQVVLKDNSGEKVPSLKLDSPVVWKVCAQALCWVPLRLPQAGTRPSPPALHASPGRCWKLLRAFLLLTGGEAFLSGRSLFLTCTQCAHDRVHTKSFISLFFL